LPPQTPAAWLTSLERKLAAQQREIQIFEDYYDGNHRLAFATRRFRQAFGSLFNAFADNWCESVVDAPVERLTAWRTGLVLALLGIGASL